MTDYYTELCFEIEGNAAELHSMFRQYELLLEDPAVDNRLPNDVLASALDLLALALHEDADHGVEISITGDTAKITGDSPNLYVVERIIQIWMRRYNRTGWISFDCSYTASKATRTLWRRRGLHFPGEDRGRQHCRTPSGRPARTR